MVGNMDEQACISDGDVINVGKMVYPDSFDDDRWNICSHGIYFFINKQ